MLELAQGLGFDLTNAFARHRELLADFFQRVVGVHADAEAHAQHALLTGGEGGEHPGRGFAQVGQRRGLERLEQLQKRLASDPNWNGGWYYENGGIARTLEEIRFETLMNYGQNEILAETMPDPKAREAAIRANAQAWSRVYDGHSMVTLRKAIGSIDITDDYDKLVKTKVLYVQSATDKLFDIALSPAYVSDMRKAGVDVTYVELPSNKGHMASHADAALWAPILGAFLKRLP